MSMSEAETAELREAKFKQWNQRKSIRDRIVSLLSQLDVDRAESTESLKEVGISLCAAELLLGEDSSKKKNYLDNESKASASTAPLQKTMKQICFKWTSGNHSFSMVKLTENEISKFSGAVKEMLYKEKDEDTGLEVDVLLSLRYFFPAIPKPREKSKPLTSDQQLQNVIFNREYNKLWKWCKEETKNRAMETSMRLQKKRKNSNSSIKTNTATATESNEKESKENNSNNNNDNNNESSSKQEKDAKTSNDKDNNDNDNDDESNMKQKQSYEGLFGGSDGITFTKYELIALQELSINRLKLWIEEDEDKKIKNKKAADDEKAKSSKKLHEQFIKVKNSLRIRMPPQDLVKKEFGKAPKLSYGREMEGIQPKTWKGPQSTVEIMAGSGLKWVHATSKGMQGMDGDLERSRKQLLEKGYVNKGNFDIDDEDDGVFGAAQYKKQLKSNEKLIERRENEIRMKEASGKAFNEWVQQKDLKEQAIKCITHINGSKGSNNNNNNNNNNTNVRKSSSGSLRNSKDNSVAESGKHRHSSSNRDESLNGPNNKDSGNSELSIPDLILIGKALKKVDRSLLSEWSAVCSHSNMNFNICTILWDSFTPVSCDVHNTAYSQVRDSFIKLLRPGIDFKAVFKDVVRKKILKLHGTDINTLDESELKQMSEDISLNKNEMIKVLSILGIAMKSGELRVLIDVFDENGDGVITLTEFMNFVGPKRDKRGGSSLSLNQKCCWSTTCKVTGMPNAYSVSVIDKATAKAKKLQIEENIKESSDGNGSINGSITNNAEIIAMNNGEFRMRVELRERKKREDILYTYGVLDENHMMMMNNKHNDNNNNNEYNDDEFENGNNSPDAHATYDDDFVNEEGDAKKDNDNMNKCAFVSWSIDQRLEGLKWLYDYTQVAREEAELNYLLTHGKVPQLAELKSAALGDKEVGYSPDALCKEMLLKWKPSSGDLVSFFSLEIGGQTGTGKERSFTEVCRDPSDASEDLKYSYWVRGLLPGATYNFRLRAFNGYGPSEYTYKSFTTRPTSPTVPRVINLSSDAVTLRWVFSKGFARRLAELRRIFEAADTDKSGNVNRQELANIIDEKRDDYNDNDDNDGYNTASSVRCVIGKELRAFLKSIAHDNGIDPNEGYAALFDKIEGDDDEDISWEEFQRFFLNSGWMNYNNGGGGGGAGDVMSTTEDNASEVGASVTSIAMKSNSGSGSTKAIKLSYSVEQCENELTDEYKEVLRTTSVTGKASIKHLLAGKSYRFRIVSINALGVAGPPSESIVVHTLIDTPPQPNLALISLPSGKYNNTSSHTSSSGNHGGTSNPAVLGVDKKASIEPYKIAITWKDRNSQIYANSRDKKFVNRMLGDWTGSQGSGESGAKSVSIEAAFSYYDKDKSGTIDPSEFALLLEDLGVEPTPDRLSFAFSQLDANNDGSISFEEFSTWWRQEDISYTLKRSEKILPKSFRKSEASSSSSSSSSGAKQEQFHQIRPRQMTYPIIPYRIGPATKTEVAGLEPNALYQFVLRYVGSRSLSPLSHPLVVMSCPVSPKKPVMFLSTANSIRVKLYPEVFGLYKFVLQLKQLTHSSSGGVTAAANVSFALPTTPMTANIDIDGWCTVFFGQETTYSCMTLASDTEYGIRVFGANYQNSLSTPSSILTFRTSKRAIATNDTTNTTTAVGWGESDRLTAGKKSSNKLHSSSSSSSSSQVKASAGSSNVTGKNKTISHIIKQANANETHLSATNMSIHSSVGRGTSVKGAGGAAAGLYNEMNFNIECRYDICVGDTILFTERLYLKQSRLHSGGGGSTMDVRTSMHDDVQSVAGSGSVKMTRVVNGKKVVRLDMSNRQSRDDDNATMMSGAASTGGATINIGHSNNNIMLGERTVAAHVVKDNYRTLQLSGQLDNSELRRNKKKQGDSAGAISLAVIEKQKMKLVKNRKLTLEVVWSRTSNIDCKKYELKAGNVIERSQDMNSMLSFEVYRCEWLKENERQSYEEERALLQDCFLEYE